jgi:uncharacterized membrane protein YccC
LWLVHPLRWQRSSVPWGAVVRGALAGGPLLGVSVVVGVPTAGVMAGLGAMLAGLNDGDGTRRTGVRRIGIPALAGACGLLLGAATAQGASRWLIVSVLFVVGLVSGAVSVLGPVWSAAGMQLLIAAVLGAGVPLTGSPWTEAGCFLLGGGWLLLLRLLVPWAFGARAASSERAVVAGVFDALADALGAVGGPEALPARRRLTSVLDAADEAVGSRRMAGNGETQRTGERFAAVAALCEATAALLWEARPLPPGSIEGVRRMAAAVRSGSQTGPLPLSGGDTAAGAAFDGALRDAALAFGRSEEAPGVAAHQAPGARLIPGLWRQALGAAGWGYGVRVAACVVAGSAMALTLHAAHWYWLPLTAAFLVKPDMGPLFSRVVSRLVGTVAGVLVFAGVSAAAGEGTWWFVVMAGLAGALIPVSTRHFALSTAVLAVMVLALLTAAGDRQADWTRLTDTMMACGIVLLVGHLPRLAGHAARIRHRVVVALRSTEAYVHHVLTVPPGERVAERRALRRAAYSALGEAKSAAEIAAAELSHRSDTVIDWMAVLAAAERIVDATTACAVGTVTGAGTPDARDAGYVTTLMLSVVDGIERPHHGPSRLRPRNGQRPERQGPLGCVPLTDVVAELQRIRTASG